MYINLRAPEPSDLDFMYRLETTPDVWRVSWGDGPVSRQMLWSYLSEYKADVYADRQLRLVVTVDGQPCGTIDISDFDPANGHAMVGVAVVPEMQCQGIASEAMRQLIAYCRDVLHMHQLAALVPRTNVASARLFQSMGFKPQGRLRSWVRTGKGYEDVLIYQLML